MNKPVIFDYLRRANIARSVKVEYFAKADFFRLEIQHDHFAVQVDFDDWKHFPQVLETAIDTFVKELKK